MTDLLSLPCSSTLLKMLIQFRGRQAFIIPMTDRQGSPLGNNGDRLMLMIFRQVLKQLDVQVVMRPEIAEAIFVPPNGALLETYSFPEILAERLSGLESKPVVIFPSSAYFPNKDPSFIFRGRTADTLWILREKYSYDHLNQRWCSQLAERSVSLVIDHDIVASGSEFVSGIIGGPLKEEHVLIAARGDKEATSLANQIGVAKRSGRLFSLGRSVYESIPDARLRSLIGRALRAKKLRMSGERLLSRIGGEFAPDLHRKKIIWSDISAPQFATFDEYRGGIRNASLVITDRLHVGLPSAILGKYVILVEAGYHKIGGVYFQSLKNCHNVTFIDR